LSQNLHSTYDQALFLEHKDLASKLYGCQEKAKGVQKEKNKEE
jgi:hypothetical protein